MKLTVMERMMALSVMPQRGSLANMRMIQELVLKLGPSSEEWEEYQMVEKDGKVTWDLTIPQEKEIDLKAAEITLIADGLKKGDEAAELTADHLSLYDKIVEVE